MKDYRFYVAPGDERTGINGYSQDGFRRKNLYLNDGMRYLRKLAKDLGLTPLPKNPFKMEGGIAVAGEVMLRGMKGDQGLMIEVGQKFFLPLGLQLRVNKLWTVSGKVRDGGNVYIAIGDRTIEQLKAILEGPNR
jgi:hypothetical protein